ncbi:MAG: hypothetical protein JXR77_13335 [Lentisphaeria bacterium]|nr:hypothetical protein [Lentisphaeria bacterium]
MAALFPSPDGTAGIVIGLVSFRSARGLAGIGRGTRPFPSLHHVRSARGRQRVLALL